MKLREFYTEKSATHRLIRMMDFTTKPKETRLIQQRLRKKGLNPTVTQIKRHLLQQLLTPIDEIPEPERTVILRYQNKEAKRFNQQNQTNRGKQKKVSEKAKK